MQARELAVLRRQTAQYIDESPTDVILTRNIKVSDGAGGSTTQASPQPAQRMRIIQRLQGPSVERRNTSGEVVRPDVVLMAEHDANLKRGDTFKWQGLTAEVVWVTDMGYELLGEVAIR